MNGHCRYAHIRKTGYYPMETPYKSLNFNHPNLKNFYDWPECSIYTDLLTPPFKTAGKKI